MKDLENIQRMIRSQLNELRLNPKKCVNLRIKLIHLNHELNRVKFYLISQNDTYFYLSLKQIALLFKNLPSCDKKKNIELGDIGLLYKKFQNRPREIISNFHNFKVIHQLDQLNQTIGEFVDFAIGRFDDNLLEKVQEIWFNNYQAAALYSIQKTQAARQLVKKNQEIADEFFEVGKLYDLANSIAIDSKMILDTIKTPPTEKLIGFFVGKLEEIYGAFSHLAILIKSNTGESIYFKDNGLIRLVEKNDLSDEAFQIQLNSLDEFKIKFPKFTDYFNKISRKLTIIRNAVSSLKE